MQLLSAKQVALRLAISRAHLYRLMRDHAFPRPLKIGERSAWSQDEVDGWITQRAEARNG